MQVDDKSNGELKKTLHIEQPYISIFASGNSLHEITSEDFSIIKKNSYVVTTNYSIIKLKGHMHVWSDKEPSVWLDNYFKKNPKEVFLMSRPQAFKKQFPCEDLKKLVDFWFNSGTLSSCFTAWWTLQLLKENYPEKTILLFGWDFYIDDKENQKYYDKFVDNDKNIRRRKAPYINKLLVFKKDTEKYLSRYQNIYNCNLKSQLTTVPKKNWREFIK